MKTRSAILAAILAAMLSALALSALPAYAAEDKAAETPSAEKSTVDKPAKPVAKKKIKPHSHALEKTGTPATKPEAAPAEPQQPLHDHGKMHK